MAPTTRHKQRNDPEPAEENVEGSEPGNGPLDANELLLKLSELVNGSKRPLTEEDTKKENKKKSSDTEAKCKRKKCDDVVLDVSTNINSSSSSDSSSDSSDSSSSDSSSDSSDDELPAPPLPVYGATLGTSVTKKITKKVKQNKFVEMSSMLTSPAFSHPDEYVVKSDKNNKARFYRKSIKQNIPFRAWEEGFDVYMSILITTAKSAKRAIKMTRDMLTYKHNIRCMHRSNHDWAGYDRHFRKLREKDRSPWAAIRPDLHVQYCLNTVHAPNRSFVQGDGQVPSSSKPKGNMKTHDGIEIPFGFCATFHSKGKRCDKGVACRYEHKCPRCEARHPVYRDCSQPSRNASQDNQSPMPYHKIEPENSGYHPNQG